MPYQKRQSSQSRGHILLVYRGHTPDRRDSLEDDDLCEDEVALQSPTSMSILEVDMIQRLYYNIIHAYLKHNFLSLLHRAK